MTNILVDAGPLIALFDGADAKHQIALKFIKDISQPPITTMPVITEASYMLSISVQQQLDFLGWVRAGAVHIEPIQPEDFTRIIKIVGKYSDLPADFADASLVAIGERLGITKVASFDSDFDVYRTHGNLPFENIFYH